jgi:hypothetical protein
MAGEDLVTIAARMEHRTIGMAMRTHTSTHSQSAVERLAAFGKEDN